MNICFTGDIIMLESPDSLYWDNNELVEVLKECDLIGGNLEMVLSGNRAAASQYCGGQWLSTESSIITEIKRYGFDYLNTANNHTMDYGIQGVRITNELLDREGIAHTGSGESLDEANKYVLKEFNGDKIAFISATASCADAAMAGYGINGLPPRGGVNMLRHDEYLYVPQEDLAIIDRIAEATHVNARFMKAVRMGIHSLPTDVHRLGRICFKKGNETEKKTSCNRKDRDRIINQIKQAKDEANYIFVSIHSHDIKGDSDDTPDDYLVEFAHACIEAGANAVIGTGTHQIKAMEYYHDCPIFYSLGNFCFKCEKMPFAPADYYERFGVSPGIDLDEFFMLRTKNGSTGLEFDPMNYRSIIPILEYKDGVLKHIKIIPLELNFSERYSLKGFPTIAHDSIKLSIKERMELLCKDNDSEISLCNNIHGFTINR